MAQLVEEAACNAEDVGSTPGLGRPSGEGNSYLLQYSSLENSMDCIVHGVANSWIQLSNFHLHNLQILWDAKTFNQFDRLGPLEERNSSAALKNFCKTLIINSQIHILDAALEKTLSYLFSSLLLPFNALMVSV